MKSAGFFLFTFTLLNLLAAKNHIVLWADASYYLLKLIHNNEFVSIEPTSRSVQLLQQLPVILAMRLGIESTESLMLVSGLANLMLPLLLTASCYWILPKEHKGFIIFPYVHYLMGAMSSWFPTVTDAPPAVAYFWVLFYLILFRAKTTWSAVLLGLLALPALYLHEAMSFLAFFLVFALFGRFKNTTNVYFKRGFLLLSGWFLFIAWYQFRAILKPRSVSNRDGFVSVLLEWKWIYWDGINIAVTLSIIAALLILFVSIINLSGLGRKLPSTMQIVRRITPLVLVGAVAGVWLLLLQDPKSYGILTQFAARSQSAFVTIPLAVIVLVSVYKKSSQIVWRDRLHIHLVTILALGIAGGHAIGLVRWYQYVQDIKWLLNNNKGFVPYEFAIEQLPDDRQSEFRTLSGWWNPTISFLLAPDGHVAAIIGTGRSNAWQPFDPCDLAQLRHSRFDVNSYLQTIEVQGCTTVFDQFNERVPFVSKIEGLYDHEKWGRWSKGEQVDFYFNKPIPERVVLVMKIQAFGPNVGVPVILKAGVTQELISFGKPEPTKVELRLTEPTYKLSFIVPNPISPKSLGINNDNRIIGLGFMSLDIYEDNNIIWTSLDFSKLKIYQ